MKIGEETEFRNVDSDRYVLEKPGSCIPDNFFRKAPQGHCATACLHAIPVIKSGGKFVDQKGTLEKLGNTKVRVIAILDN